MKNHLLLSALQTAIILVNTACRLSADPIPEDKPRTAIGVLTSAKAQEDFDLMRKALEEAHTGLYRYSTKAQMDETFAVQRAKLSQPVKKTEFMNVVSETLAAIHCGHTSCDPDDEIEKAESNALLFPLRLLLEGSRLMVLFNETRDDQTIRPGMEILEINGHKVSDIIDRIFATESSDGDTKSGKKVHISGGFGKLYWRLVEQTNVYAIKAQDSSGRSVTATLSGVTNTQRKENQNPVNTEMKAGVNKLVWSGETLAFRFLKDPEVAEIRPRYFLGDEFPKWVEETFRLLRAKSTKTLIIDLRGNGGGQDEYGAMLISYLTDKPFRYFDHINIKTIHPSFVDYSDWRTDSESNLRDGTTPDPSGGYLVTEKLHHGLATQAPGKYPFMGKVFVLTDGGTFSTAADFCAVVHHLKRAIFIGEETGGGYNGNNSGPEPRLTLPNSKLRVRLPMYEYWNAVQGYAGNRRGTIPDHEVETRTASLLHGVDDQLELAFKLAN